MLGLSFNTLPHYVYGNDRQFIEHEHHMNRIFDEDVLLIMRKGTLRFTEDGVPVELHEGEYYLQRAHLKQTGEVESDLPNYFFFHFHGKFEEGGKLPIRGTFSMETIQPLLEGIAMLGFGAEKMEYERYFYAVLSELAKQQRNESVAENIRTFILKNYTKKISLEDVADHCYLSVNTVIETFKQTYGRTPHRYLTDCRLEKACELLVSTTRPITSICLDVGFEEYSVFYRAFSVKYKTSPAEYRKIRHAEFFIPPENERV